MIIIIIIFACALAMTIFIGVPISLRVVGTFDVGFGGSRSKTCSHDEVGAEDDNTPSKNWLR